MKQLHYLLYVPIARDFHFNASQILFYRGGFLGFRGIKSLLVIKILYIRFVPEFILLGHYGDQIPKAVDFSLLTFLSLISFRKRSFDPSFGKGGLPQQGVQKSRSFRARSRQNGPALTYKQCEIKLLKNYFPPLFNCGIFNKQNGRSFFLHHL